MPPEQPSNVPSPPTTITITYPNKSAVAQMVNILAKTRPKGWSRKSCASYYKRSYAEWIKRDIDKMIEDRKPIVFRYNLWPKLSRNSLYLRVNQAIKYLTDPENLMDPEGKYVLWFHEVRVKRIAGVGVVLEFDPVLEGGEPQGEHVSGDVDIPRWKRIMDEWLESDSVEPFIQEGLMLTPAQIDRLKDELDGVDTIDYDVTSFHVKIIKR